MSEGNNLHFVLVVEDDEDLRELIAEVVASAGYPVITVGDGDEALAIMRARPPAFITLDLLMPRVDGWKLAAIMARDPVLSRIPYCVVSATVEAAPAAAVTVLCKPVRTRDLLRLVELHVPRADERAACRRR